MVLCGLEQVPEVAAGVPPGTPRIAVLDDLSEADAALEAGAFEVIGWPGSAALLRRRIAIYTHGQVGPGRVALDPRRASSLAHAIRNPLNVITLYGELLKMEPLGEDGLGSVGRVIRAAKRVDALVGELESLLYLEAGLTPVRKQPFELGEVVEILLAELRHDIEDKPLHVLLELAPEGSLVEGDPDLARRALNAVFSRVAKLSLGESRIELRTSATAPQLEVIAPIEPVPPDQAESLRHAATELDAREALGGVGVGSSFASRALAAMGGKLEHDATEDGRARTLVSFPSPS